MTKAQTRFADALRRVFPTALASHLQFRGWIRQETLCDQSSAIFHLRQCEGGDVRGYGLQLGLTPGLLWASGWSPNAPLRGGL